MKKYRIWVLVFASLLLVMGVVYDKETDNFLANVGASLLHKKQTIKLGKKEVPIFRNWLVITSKKYVYTIKPKDKKLLVVVVSIPENITSPSEKIVRRIQAKFPDGAKFEESVSYSMSFEQRKQIEKFLYVPGGKYSSASESITAEYIVDGNVCIYAAELSNEDVQQFIEPLAKEIASEI